MPKISTLFIWLVLFFFVVPSPLSLAQVDDTPTVDPCAGNPFPETCRRQLERARDAVGRVNPDAARAEYEAAIGRLGEAHPWRDIGGSEAAYLEDAMKIWAGMAKLPLGNFGGSSDADKIKTCVEPRLIKQTCEYCQPKLGGYVDRSCSIPFFNFGMVMEFWWPELIIDINNFGISAINVGVHGQPWNHHASLLAQTQTLTRAHITADLMKTGVDLKLQGFRNVLNQIARTDEALFDALQGFASDISYIIDDSINDVTQVNDRLNNINSMLASPVAGGGTLGSAVGASSSLPSTAGSGTIGSTPEYLAMEDRLSAASGAFVGDIDARISGPSSPTAQIGDFRGALNAVDALTLPSAGEFIGGRFQAFSDQALGQFEGGLGAIESQVSQIGSQITNLGGLADVFRSGPGAQLQSLFGGSPGALSLFAGPFSGSGSLQAGLGSIMNVLNQLESQALSIAGDGSALASAFSSLDNITEPLGTLDATIGQLTGEMDGYIRAAQSNIQAAVGGNMDLVTGALDQVRATSVALQDISVGALANIPQATNIPVIAQGLDDLRADLASFNATSSRFDNAAPYFSGAGVPSGSSLTLDSSGQILSQIESVQGRLSSGSLSPSESRAAQAELQRLDAELARSGVGTDGAGELNELRRAIRNNPLGTATSFTASQIAGLQSAVGQAQVVTRNAIGSALTDLGSALNVDEMNAVYNRAQELTGEIADLQRHVASIGGIDDIADRVERAGQRVQSRILNHIERIRASIESAIAGLLDFSSIFDLLGYSLVDFPQAPGAARGATGTSGSNPQDQTERKEAHVYSSPIQDYLTRNARQPGKGVRDLRYRRTLFGLCIPFEPFLYNGLFKGNPEGCFYNMLDEPSDTIKAWTESAFPVNYAGYWNIPRESRDINPVMYDGSIANFDQASMNRDWSCSGSAEDLNDYQTSSCASYRVGVSEALGDNRYSELQNPPMCIRPLTREGSTSGEYGGEATPRGPLDAISCGSDGGDRRPGELWVPERNCYYGGSDLYPLTGTETNIQNDYMAAAVFARRALELAGNLTNVGEIKTEDIPDDAETEARRTEEYEEQLSNTVALFNQYFGSRGGDEDPNPYREEYDTFDCPLLGTLSEGDSFSTANLTGLSPQEAVACASYLGHNPDGDGANIPTVGNVPLGDYDPNHCVEDDHVNRFTKFVDIVDDRMKEVDKLQFIRPDGLSECFRMSEVDEENIELFPPGAQPADELGSIRLIYWNKRKACVCELRGWESSREQSNGPDTWTAPWTQFYSCLVSGAEDCGFGWGCMNYPRTSMDQGRGNMEYDTVDGSIGGISGLRAMVPFICAYPYTGSGWCGQLVGRGWIDSDVTRSGRRVCEGASADGVSISTALCGGGEGG